MTHRVSILGIARTGIAAANALADRGWDVLLSDIKGEPELSQELALVDPRVTVVTCRNEVRPGDLVVISPGIKPLSATFRLAHELGSEVVSDIELFYRLSPAPMLCVTGTDGKSTTTALLAQMCRDAGHDTFLGGNIGVGIMSGLDRLRSTSVVVAEVSCFQLIHCPTLRPKIAVYTNIAEDHIDYHGSYQAYQEAKRLLMANMGEGDVLVLNADDPIISSWPVPGGPRILRYSRIDEVSAGAWADADRTRDRRRGEATPDNTDRTVIPSPQEPRPGDPVPSVDGATAALWFRDESGQTWRICELREIRIPGPHNLENALAAAAAALAFGLPAGSIRHTLATFPGLEHRIEHVADLRGISFYNDSKATNPHAAIPGLSAFGSRPVVAICGGYEKGSDFGDFGRHLVEKTSGVVLIGQTAPRIEAAIGKGAVPVERAASLKDAVHRAYRMALPGGVVTLCPACASFDMFKDYEDRGRAFKAVVADLVGRES